MLHTNSLIRDYLFLTLLVGMLSCRALKEPEYRSIEHFRLNKIDVEETTLLFGMKYMNPNNSNLKLKKADGDVYLNNILLGQFTVDTLIRISRQAEFSLPVKVKVDMNNFMKNSMTILLNPTVMVKLTGKAKAGKGLLFFNYPIHYEGEHSLRELMDSTYLK